MDVHTLLPTPGSSSSCVGCYWIAHRKLGSECCGVQKTHPQEPEDGAVAGPSQLRKAQLSQARPGHRSRVCLQGRELCLPKTRVRDLGQPGQQLGPWGQSPD